MEDILDSLNICVIVLDDRLHIKYLNPAAEMFFSASYQQIKHKAYSALFSDVSLQDKIEKTLLLGNNFTEREYAFSRYNQTRYVDISISQLISKSPGVVIEIFTKDEHLHIAFEEKLLAQQRTSQAMLRSMAHEVKNPLGGIRGAAQLLRKELNNKALDEYTDVIINETDRLSNLVDRMLGPKGKMQKKWVNIHAITEQVRKLVRKDAKFKDISCLIDYDPSIPEVYAVEQHLIQVVLNLTQNAAQALKLLTSAQQKTITYRTRICRRACIGSVYYRLICQLDIIDNGPGVEKSKLEQIFMPLITGRNDGTGLGLSLAQSMINQNKGLIECKSEPGETIFSILLPIIEQAEDCMK